MSLSYANPASGPSAGGIGWFNFGNITLTPGDTIVGLTGVLNDGSTVTFDLSLSNVSGANRDFTAVSTPTWAGTFFGNSNYTGILGNVALESQFVFLPGSNSLTLSNIVMLDSNANPVTNFTAVVADAESTGLAEIWRWTTNGGNWDLFATLGNSSSPTLIGVGTQSVSITGNLPVNENDYLLTTQNPTNLILNSETTNNAGGQQAVAIGFAVTKVSLVKNIGERIDPADQFVLNIAGTPNDQATTTGNVDGIQTEFASVFGIPGNVYTVNESMAPGSVSTLADYTVLVSAANATPGGSIPPMGVLPINFAPALGDDVTYTIINAAPETFLKTVDKAYADIGEVLTYTVSINNPNNFTVNNVVMTDATPVGTTYIGNLIVSAPFVGTDPSTGITITAIGPDETVTVSWQVMVNDTVPISNPIMNFANVVVPNGTSGMTNVVDTQISHAFIGINKNASPAFADVGDEITYTLNLTNLGNVTANNVVITDPIPAGTTYVAGSISGTVPFVGDPTSTISIVAIPAGGNASITYKVKVGNAVPNPNPILNTAGVEFTYTVDPSDPNGANGSNTSNTTETLVSTADLTIIKDVDKAIAYVGDILTYQIAVKNTGNVSANNVVITDNIPNGTSYVANSLTASVAFVGSPLTTIQLVNPIDAGETVYLSFKVKVETVPTPKTIENTASADFTYTVNPLIPDGVSGQAVSNIAATVIFKNNFSQEISDLINSIALQQAALGAIANAEGAKIQKIIAMDGVSSNQLLCLNKSVTEVLESIATLESILKMKLSSVDCQIDPVCV